MFFCIFFYYPVQYLLDFNKSSSKKNTFKCSNDTGRLWWNWQFCERSESWSHPSPSTGLGRQTTTTQTHQPECQTPHYNKHLHQISPRCLTHYTAGHWGQLNTHYHLTTYPCCCRPTPLACSCGGVTTYPSSPQSDTT